MDGGRFLSCRRLLDAKEESGRDQDARQDAAEGFLVPGTLPANRLVQGEQVGPLFLPQGTPICPPGELQQRIELLWNRRFFLLQEFVSPLLKGRPLALEIRQHLLRLVLGDEPNEQRQVVVLRHGLPTNESVRGPQSIEAALLLGVEEQPGERFILAVEHLQAHHLVGWNDLGEAKEQREHAAEVGVALVKLLGVRAVGRGRVYSQLPGRILHEGLPFGADVAADPDRLPQPRLPRRDFSGECWHILLPGGSHAGADHVERMRGRFVRQRLPENPEVLWVQFLLCCDVLGCDSADEQRVAVADSGHEVRLDIQPAVGRDVCGVELSELGGAFVGPVAARLRR